MEILARAVGRRKEAVAQVQMIKGTGLVIINNKPANDYLQNNSCAILAVQAPFYVFNKNSVSLLGRFDKMNTLTTEVTTSNNNGSSSSRADHGQGQGQGQAGDAEENLANNNMSTNAATLIEIDTIIKVKGGGLKGQADAIRLGIARALCLLDSAGQAATLNAGLQTNSNAAGSLHHNAQAARVTTASTGLQAETMVVGLKKQLKDKGYLTQDARVKERRKYGLKKARKASQYHKR